MSSKNATGPQVDQNREDEDGRLNITEEENMKAKPSQVDNPSVVTLERKAIRLYSKSYNSNRGVMAIQYENDFEPLNPNPDFRPIYVGYDGEVGRPLDEVLRENDSYRAVLGDKNYFQKTAELRDDVDAQLSMIQRANTRITDLETKRGLSAWLRKTKRAI